MGLEDLTIQNGAPESMTPSGPHRGAFWDGQGVNFSIASKNAERIELCLFDDKGEQEIKRVTLPGHTGNVFHGYIPGLAPGQVYGYRVHGPYDPSRGLLFNPAKLMFDPTARETIGTFIYDDINNGASPDDASQPDPRDNAAFVVKARVPKPLPAPDESEKPAFPRKDNVIYEANVRGLTMKFPVWPVTYGKTEYAPNVVPTTDPAVVAGELYRLPPGVQPGTPEALTSPPVMHRIKRQGNTIELQPVNYGLSERRLVNLGLRNLWNYNALGWFAPDPRLFPGGIRQVVDTVKKLHGEGCKVVLDFAFNHTCEIDERGTRGYLLSLRGIDNSTYYRLREDDRRVYENWTGCDNTINIDEPETQRLILDALRFWIKEVGADGIRFDLAAILGRDKYADFSPDHPFFKAMMADPIISKAELFLEPWDARDSFGGTPAPKRGNQLGHMPAGTAEWNGRYRDEVREFWRGDAGMIGKMAARLTGSADIFGHKSTSPHASVNAITFHDGFTLRDLNTYDNKHNEKNCEDNRDGERDNRSSAYGPEGPTTDPAINTVRLQQMRNLRATLFLSQGTPLVLQGDEVGNTQHGNNNAYCQDNETGWVKWDDSPEARQIEDFSAYCKSLRDEFAILRHDEYLHGERKDKCGVPDIQWFAPGGHEQTGSDWSNSWARCFGMMLNGGAVSLPGQDSRRLFAVFNAHSGTVDFQLPDLPGGHAGWTRIMDTSQPELRQNTDGRAYKGNETYEAAGRSVTLFVQNPQPRPS
jgi:isoamylase